jgi:hypothetical protein
MIPAGTFFSAVPVSVLYREKALIIKKRSNAQIRPCMRARRREKEGTAITKKWKI